MSTRKPSPLQYPTFSIEKKGRNYQLQCVYLAVRFGMGCRHRGSKRIGTERILRREGVSYEKREEREGEKEAKELEFM